MTLRTRLAVLVSAAVALAVLAASVAAWFLIRGTLMDDIDQRLLDRVPHVDRIIEGWVTTGADGGGLPAGDANRMAFLVGDPIGVQQVDADGTVLSSVAPADVDLAMVPEEHDLLGASPRDPVLRTVAVDGRSYRVMSTALDGDSFIRMVSLLDDVEDTLMRMAGLLAGVACLGVAGAGGLGFVIGRAGLRPVATLTEAAEEVAATKDLAHRIQSIGSGKDEIARLAHSMNTMLAALDGARTEQRHLVENAGHELRTPLAILRNDIGLLIRADQHPDRVLTTTDRSNLLRDLDSEAAALTDLVAELVELARGDTEPEPPAEADLRSLVDRAVQRTRRVNPQVGVEVHGSGFEAIVRPAMLERAVANLVRNAMQVSEPGGLVEVQLAERGGEAVMRVLDRGPGVAEHDLPRLFDRFYRGDGARERHGSGLGLAIVAQAAQLHGGNVEVANRDDGGATFTLTIPINSDATPEFLANS